MSGAGGHRNERIIVCGSRGWTDRARIADRLFDVPVTATIVHGNAKGADRIAQRAGLVRNEEMALLGADLCIAFWDGRSTGTLHMMNVAEAAAIDVEVVAP